MTTPQRLSSDDHCHLQLHFLDRWNPPSISPKDILMRSVEHGLASEEPGEAAADYAMELATQTTIDTAETDLLGVASHIGTYSGMLAWTLQGENGVWERPPAKVLPEGSRWESGAFLSASGLRRVALVDRLDAMTEVALRNSWGVQGECAVYDEPMNLIVVEMGSMRAGRWSNPFTTGYRHPQAKVLRFRKRDGDAFGANWTKVWMSEDDATREEWLDAMSEDGVLAELVHVVSVEPSERRHELIALAERKLSRMRQQEMPEPQLSRCFDRMKPCPFRRECPNGTVPTSATYSMAREAWPLFT